LKMILAFIGVSVAIFTRTFLAYRYKLIRALIRGEAVRWNHKYLLSSVFALAYGFLSTMVVVPAVALPDDPLHLIFVFITSLFYGWGINDAYNKIFIDWTKYWKMVRIRL